MQTDIIKDGKCGCTNNAETQERQTDHSVLKKREDCLMSGTESTIEKQNKSLFVLGVRKRSLKLSLKNGQRLIFQTVQEKNLPVTVSDRNIADSERRKSQEESAPLRVKRLMEEWRDTTQTGWIRIHDLAMRADIPMSCCREILKDFAAAGICERYTNRHGDKFYRFF
jgi:ribosomal protein S25